jgi:hypothetical protein
MAQRKPKQERIDQFPIVDLKPHPRNYQAHPEEQRAHIRKSLETFGYYRNIVIAKDGTILAGHGVAESARDLGHKVCPVIKLNISPDDPRALKLLVNDNEIRNLADVDDIALAEILSEISTSDIGLEGTGYDEIQFAALSFLIQAPSPSANHQAEWEGLPEFAAIKAGPKLVIMFDTLERRAEFVESITSLGMVIQGDGTWSGRFPHDGQRSDLKSVAYLQEDHVEQ